MLEREEIIFSGIEHRKRKPKICLCSQAQEISDKSSWIYRYGETGNKNVQLFGNMVVKRAE